MSAPPRVLLTETAAGLLRRLRERHGALMFHQSGGCCDGSSPMCYPEGEFIVGDRDVLLGIVEDTPDVPPSIPAGCDEERPVPNPGGAPEPPGCDRPRSK